MLTLRNYTQLERRSVKNEINDINNDFFLKSSFIQCCVLYITFFLLCDWQLFEDNLNKVFSNAKTHRLD